MRKGWRRLNRVVGIGLIFGLSWPKPRTPTSDAINPLLAAAGHNLRLILKAAARWRPYILATIERTA
jgi:hypothetical protein